MCVILFRCVITDIKYVYLLIIIMGENCVILFIHKLQHCILSTAGKVLCFFQVCLQVSVHIGYNFDVI
jgi:hypothetical protein